MRILCDWEVLMKGKPWYVWLGKLAPWAAAAVTAFVKEVLEIDITWLPTAIALALGLVQLIISFVKPAEPA